MTPMMFSAVAFSPSWRATSSATMTWRSCFFSELPWELEKSVVKIGEIVANTGRIYQSIMILLESFAFVRAAAVLATSSVEKLGPELEPRRITWHEGFPSVSTTGSQQEK